MNVVAVVKPMRIRMNQAKRTCVPLMIPSRKKQMETFIAQRAIIATMTASCAYFAAWISSSEVKKRE